MTAGDRPPLSLIVGLTNNEEALLTALWPGEPRAVLDVIADSPRLRDVKPSTVRKYASRFNGKLLTLTGGKIEIETGHSDNYGDWLLLKRRDV